MSSRIYTNEDIANKTRLYFEGINNIENPNVPTDLTEVAQAHVKKYQHDVMVPNADGKLNENFSNAIRIGREMYLAEHPEKEQISTDLTRTAEMQAIHGENAPVRALVKKEESPLSLPRAGYINIAILLYGTLNIGIILAIALMK